MLRLLTLGLLAHSTKQLNPSVEKNELVPQSDDVIYVTTNKECYISEGNLGLFKKKSIKPLQTTRRRNKFTEQEMLELQSFAKQCGLSLEPEILAKGYGATFIKFYQWLFDNQLWKMHSQFRNKYHPVLRSFGDTANHLAVKFDSTLITRTTNFWPINDRNFEGQTSLHLAIILNNSHAVTELCRNGANIKLKYDNKEKSFSYTVFDLAVEVGSPSIFEVMYHCFSYDYSNPFDYIKQEAPNLFYVALKSKQYEMVSYLLSHFRYANDLLEKSLPCLNYKKTPKDLPEYAEYLQQMNNRLRP